MMSRLSSGALLLDSFIDFSSCDFPTHIVIQRYDQDTREVKSESDNGIAKGTCVVASSGAVLGKVLQGDNELTWEQGRAVYINAMAEAFPDSSGNAITSIDFGGVPATVIKPNQLLDGRVLFYIHGGGYVSGSPHAYHGLAGRYAKQLRAEVVMPDYRLAPQHPFPAPIEDVARAYRALLERGTDPRSIVVSGDSAGGAMVITLMRKLRDAGLPLPVAGVAISPWANLGHTGASMNDREAIDPSAAVKH